MEDDQIGKMIRCAVCHLSVPHEKLWILFLRILLRTEQKKNQYRIVDKKRKG